MIASRPTTFITCIVLLVICGLASAKEITQVSDYLYVAGQPAAEEFVIFAAQGGRHVINLRPPEETPDFNEAAAVTRSGMAYYNIPIAGAAGLTRDNVEQLDRLLAKLEGEKTLLHCSSSNRVGALMALRAKWLHGASFDEALAVGTTHGLTSLQPQVEALLRTE
jgi:uncharacterized protein (TIGR01244 family)